MHEGRELRSGSEWKPKDVVDMDVTTPDAQTVVAAVIAAPFFDREQFSIDVRERRSVFKRESSREITRPVPAPLLDIDQELGSSPRSHRAF
jgi:hypothetical protein